MFASLVKLYLGSRGFLFSVSRKAAKTSSEISTAVAASPLKKKA